MTKIVITMLLMMWSFTKAEDEGMKKGMRDPLKMVASIQREWPAIEDNVKVAKDRKFLGISAAGFSHDTGAKGPTSKVFGQEYNECCHFKTVGLYNYTLIENEAAPDSLGCNSPCVYMKDREPESRYCFKKGSLTVTCSTKTPFKTIFNDLNLKVFMQVFVNDGNIYDVNIPPKFKIDVKTGQATVRTIQAATSTDNICMPLRDPPAIQNIFRVR